MERIQKIGLFIWVIWTFGAYSGAAYINPTPGKIPLIGSTPIPEGRPITVDALKTFKECGFDAGLFWVDSAEELNDILKIGETAGIKVIPSGKILRSDSCVEFVNKFIVNSTFSCWNFVDEPRYEKLRELKTYYDRIRRADPNKLILINLIGSKMKQFVGNSPNMASYLDTIQRIFSPQVWCYDYYPMWVKDGSVKVYRDSFYSDLEIFSSMSRLTGIPFWTYLQTMAFKNNVIERPAATLTYIRFVAFSALAYGAQGILYWTYGQRFTTKYETYFSALVSLDGKKTAAWYAACQVNREINALNDVFYNAMFLDCRHSGDVLYRDTKKLTDNFGPLEHLTSGSEGVIVSHLKNGDYNYLIIVSRDPFKSQNVRLGFKDDIEVEQVVVVSDSNDFGINYSKVDKFVKNKLAPGGYLIYRWK